MKNHAGARRGILWPIGTAAIALATGAVLTACGGGPPAAAPSTGRGQITSQTLDAYATCMRDHGLPDFYFSNVSSAAGSALTDEIKLGPWVAPADPSSPQFQTAMKACRHLLPIPQMSQAQMQKQLRSLDQQAACIRARGFPDYPDPSAQGGEIMRPDLPSDIDQNSPQFQSAQQACSKG